MNRQTCIALQLVSSISIVLLSLSCAATRPATDAVVSVENLSCEQCKPLQEEYFNSLLSLAERMPFSMKANTMGFVDWRDSIYFSVQLVGEHYNTIQTTITTRLTNEFHEKYQETVRLILNEPFVDEVVGLHVVLICTSSNFVSDKYGLNSEPNTLEIFASSPTIRQFLNGDISGQDLLDKSVVFVDAQRTEFTLQMM
jgi:hypothetical protein